MINFNVAVSNPFSNRFKNLYSTADQLYKNKFWEFEVYASNTLAELGLNITTRCDHAGIDLTIGLLGYTIHLQVYDNRHWNYDEGRYMIYTEDQGLH